MKKYFVLFLYLFAGVLSSKAQYVFQKKYENIESVEKNISGNLFLTTYKTNGTFFYATIVSIDINGDTIFTKQYVKQQQPECFIANLKLIYPNSLMMYGLNNSLNIHLQGITHNGDTLWTKKLGRTSGSIYCHPRDLVKGPSNGYYLNGTKVQGLFPFLGNVVIRLNAQGDTVWTRCFRMAPLPVFTGENHEENSACAASPDGGVVITGMVMDSAFWPRSSYIIKLDSNGTIQWKKFIDKPNSNHIFQMHTTATGYLAIGVCSLTATNTYNSIYTSEFGTMVIKLDFNGNVQWAKMYRDIKNGGYAAFDGGAHYASLLNENGNIYRTSVQQLPPMDFNDPNFRRHRKLVQFETDSTGNLLWATKANINVDDIYPTSACRTNDKGYLLSNLANFDFTVPPNGLSYKGILLKSDSLGHSCSDSSLALDVVNITSLIVTSDTINPVISYYPVTVGHTPFTYSRGIQYNNLCIGTVGVEEAEKEQKNEEIKVYPNPASTQLTILTTNHQHLTTIKIYNVLGEEVLSQMFLSQNSREVSIDISVLQQGVYILEAITDKGEIRKKFVKQ